jgi:hypothetical protein
MLVRVPSKNISAEWLEVHLNSKAINLQVYSDQIDRA